MGAGVFAGAGFAGTAFFTTTGAFFNTAFLTAAVFTTFAGAFFLLALAEGFTDLEATTFLATTFLAGVAFLAALAGFAAGFAFFKATGLAFPPGRGEDFFATVLAAGLPVLLPLTAVFFLAIALALRWSIVCQGRQKAYPTKSEDQLNVMCCAADRYICGPVGTGIGRMAR